MAHRHDSGIRQGFPFLEKSFNINEFLFLVRLHAVSLHAFPQTTVMKKMMYYNMRVHTAQKNLRETGHRLTEQKEALWKPPVDQIRACGRAIKDV